MWLVARFILILLALALPVAAQQKRVLLQGVVYSTEHVPLAGVKIVPDEFGAGRDTDSQGRFSVTVPPEVAKTGRVRLSFSLENHQTYSLDLKLPASRPIEVILNPLFMRGLQPSLPPGLVSRLRVYRREEIQRIHRFLGSTEKRVLVVEGIAGIGVTELVLTALQDAPASSRRPIFWWDCEETDSLGTLIQEWARVFQDQNLLNLGLKRKELAASQEARNLDRQAIAWILLRMARSPHTVVLGRFDRWLLPKGQEIADPTLAEFLAKVASHEQRGKILLLSGEKPVLPQELGQTWAETLSVFGLRRNHAVDFLQEHLSLEASSDLLSKLASRLNGHPAALQLFAGSVLQLSKLEQEDRIRQFLEVGGSTLPGGSLKSLLAKAYARLAPKERQVLDLLAIVREPLATDEMEEIGLDVDPPLTSQEVRDTVESLVHQRYWVDLYENPGRADHYAPIEVARQFLYERLLEAKPQKKRLHKLAFVWYRTRCKRAEISSSTIPSLSVLKICDEFIHQSLALAELATGLDAEEATLEGSRVVLALFNWHLVRDEYRLMFEQLGRARRALGRLPAHDDIVSLRAEVTVTLGDLYFRTGELLKAEQLLVEVVPLYEEAKQYAGKANVLKLIGDMSVRQARLSEARLNYMNALYLYRSNGIQQGEANTLKALAHLELRMSKIAEAEKFYKQALPLYRVIRDPLGEANTLEGMGDLYLRKGDLRSAEEFYLAAVPLYRSLESRLGQANVQKSLGDLYLRRDQLKEAENFYKDSLTLYKEVESRLGQANSLAALGFLYARMAQHLLAEEQYADALTLYNEIDYGLGKANALMLLGDLYLKTGRMQRAGEQHKKALESYRQLGDRLGEANTLLSVGAWHAIRGEAKEAIEKFAVALGMYQQLGEYIGQIKCHLSLADINRRVLRSDEAASEALKALTLGAKVEPPQLAHILEHVDGLRLDLGEEMFDSAASLKLEQLPAELRQKLSGLLKMLPSKSQERVSEDWD